VPKVVANVTGEFGTSLAAALDAGIPAARRDVFLDSSRDPADIRAQLERLKRKARSHGVAVAIGHPYPETIALLEESLPALIEEGFELVPASAVLTHGHAALDYRAGSPGGG
jgi:polysaccharide deacetylase 2 family uncharacterized protein YibQ